MGLSQSNLDMLEAWVGSKFPAAGIREPCIVARLYPYNLTTAAAEELWVADRTYRTDGTAAAGLQHKLALGRLRSEGVEISIEAGGRPLGRTLAVARRRPLRIVNSRDRFTGVGVYDPWFAAGAYAWENRRVELWLGPRSDASFAEFDLFSTALVAGLPAHQGDEVVVDILPPLLVDTRGAMQRTRYGGWAYCYDFDGSASCLTADEEYNVGKGDATWYIRFRTEEASDGAARFLFHKGTWSSQGYGLAKTTTDTLVFAIGDGTAYNLQLAGSWHDLADGEWHDVLVVLDRAAQELQGWLDGVAVSPTSVSGLGTVADAGHYYVGRKSNAAEGYFLGELDNPVVVLRALNEAEREELRAGPLPADFAGLVAQYTLDEDTGTAAENTPQSRAQKSVVLEADNDYIAYGNVLDQTTDSFTWGQWVRIWSGHSGFGTRGNHAVMGKKNTVATASHAGWMLAVGGTSNVGRPVASVSDGSTQVIVAGASGEEIHDGRWYLVWAVVDRAADELRLYVDGDLIDTGDITSVGSLTNTFNLLSGISASTGEDLMAGRVGPAFVFEGARSVAEVWGVLEDDHLVGTEPGLVGYWPYSEGTGTKVENVAVARNGLVLSSQWVDFGDRNAFDQYTRSFTCGGWFKSSTAATQVVQGKRTTGQGYALQVDSDGEVRATVSDGTTEVSAVTSGVDVLDGRWHHLMLYVKRSVWQEVQVWVDGIEEASGDISSVGTLANALAYRHGSLSTGGSPVQGALGAQCWFSGIRNPGAIYAAMLQRPLLANEGGLRAYWPYDEGSGSSIAGIGPDAGAAGTTASSSWENRHGTIVGGAPWTKKEGIITAGTGGWAATLEGTEELRGKPKPRGRGPCRGVLAACVDPNGHTYDGSTGYPYQFDTGPGVEVWSEDTEIRVYEGGLLATPGTDYDEWLDRGMIIWRGSLPENPVTVDFRGMLSTGLYSEGQAAIAEDLLLDHQGLAAAQIDTASRDALAAALTYGTHSYLAHDQELTVEQAMAEVLGPAAWWATTLEGDKIAFGHARDPAAETAALSLEEKHLGHGEGLRRRLSPPTPRTLRIQYQRQHHTLTAGNSVLGAVNLSELQRQGQEYREVEIPPAGAAHAPGAELVLQSHIDLRRDAQAEGERLYGLLVAERELLEATPVRQMLRAYVGSVVEVTDRRYGLSIGKKYLCLGVVYVLDASYPEFRLLLWG